MFSEHLREFEGKPVVDYEQGMSLEPDRNCYRLRLEYDSDVEFSELLADFLSQPGVDRVTGLITGAYSDEMHDESMGTIIENVVAAAPRLPSLTGLFFGDILSEENEVSWIVQGDASPVWSAFPRLKTLCLRGSGGLTLGQIAHDQLQKLVIECGGLPANVLREIAAAQLPELQHLELYLGTPNYGWDGTIDDVRPLLAGNLFPKLKYLGLRDSEIADEVAAAVCSSPLVERVEVLDLSLGILTDAGGEALLRCPAVARLKGLNLQHHYLSNAVMQRLAALPLPVNVDDQTKPDNYGGQEYRYVAVGE